MTLTSTMLRPTVVAKFDAWQRRHAAAALLIALARKFGEDSASSLAALITYYAFLSLFPLLLVFVSALGIGPAGERAAAVAISLAADTGFFLALFALLTPRPWRIGDLLPGVVLARLGWLVLQSVGGWYVDHTVAGASSTHGTFALVIGLLSWLWVGSQLPLVAAEANVVLRRRLWPRSLSGNLESADRVALERLAETTIADPRERVAVSFDEARRRG